MLDKIIYYPYLAKRIGKDEFDKIISAYVNEIDMLDNRIEKIERTLKKIKSKDKTSADFLREEEDNLFGIKSKRVEVYAQMNLKLVSKLNKAEFELERNLNYQRSLTFEKMEEKLERRTGTIGSLFLSKRTKKLEKIREYQERLASKEVALYTKPAKKDYNNSFK